MSKKVLVFGPRSWIASYCRELFIKNGVIWLEAAVDIRLKSAVKERIDHYRPNVILNFAACGHRPMDQDRYEIFDVNFNGIRNIIDSAPDDTPIIQAGTGLEGKSQTPYALTKLKATKELMKRGNATVLRLFNVYGEREPNRRLFPTLVRHMRRGEYPPLGNPDVQHDWIHAEEVSLYFWRASHFKGNAQSFDVGKGVSWSLEETTEVFNKHFKVTDSPKWNCYHTPFAMLNYKANTINAHDKLGIVNLFSFQEGVERYVDRYDAPDWHEESELDIEYSYAR